MSAELPSGDFIPLNAPQIRGRAWENIKSCLDDEWVSNAGPFVDRFEREFAAYVGARFAVACNSGSASLHVSLLLAGVGKDDLVLMPTLTFIATANAVRYCGAEPFFFDCDPYYNIDAGQVNAFLLEHCEQKGQMLRHRSSGRRVAAILPVHGFGNAADMDALLPLAHKLNVPVVEDAAASLGTRYSDGRHTGTLGRLGCFSFNGNKIVTTGGGGMIVTNEPELAARARYLTTQAKHDEARSFHDEVGFNYRLTNMPAALGCAQLERIEEVLQRKREIYATYKKELAGVPGLELGPVPSYASNNHWLPCLLVNAAEYGENWEKLMLRLAKAEIQTRPAWELCHRQKPYLASERMSLKKSERLHSLTLNIPCSAGLTDSQQKRVIAELRRRR